MINRILFYNSGGGLGDAIQIMPLIEALRGEFNNAEFYYLCAHDNHFNSTLKDFKCTIQTLDLRIKYFGFRWWHPLIVKKVIKKNKIAKFDLIVDLQSKIRNSLILKMIPHKYFISSCLNFALSNPNINVKKEKKINNTIINAINFIFNKNLKLIEYDISKIDKKFADEAKRLLPEQNYVGFSISQGNVYRKKEWPIKSIVDLCQKIDLKNKTPVFFIEKKNKELKNKIKLLVPNSLFPEHETNLSSPALVTCLAKRLDFAISIDNGIMHMLSLAKIPMVVLFGPTSSEKFAPDYNNLIVLDSKKLKNVSDISSISAQDVLQEVRLHSNFLY